MTHAFFKALLFMAAGSVISAMAGEQSLNRMSGFKRAMPFTYACFVIGGLALAGVPPFSGFFSKDEILADIGSRGGGWWVFYVAGYVGAILTAIYTWRMIFRAFWGEPCPEARELEEGHIHHAEAPFNPANGEIEDTDVGFPGPEHHIAERAVPMKVAMGALAVLATFGGLRAGAVGRLGGREVPRADVRRLHAAPRPQRRASPRSAWCSAPCSGWPASTSPTGSGSCSPGTSARVQRALRASCTGSSSTSGTSTSSSTSSWCGRAAWLGRFGQQTFERVVINGALRRRDDGDRQGRLGRRPGAAERLPARLRRPARAGHRRRRLLLPDPELMTPMNLTILVWLPLAAVIAGFVLPATEARFAALLGSGADARARRGAALPLRRRPAGAAVRHRQDVDQPAGHPLQARRRRAEPLPHRAGGAAVLRQHRVGGAARVGAPAPVLPVVRPGRERRAGRAHGPGPRALRDLLRRHARAVPVPGRRLGHDAQPRGEHGQALHLHARRLAADALRGDRHRRARARATASPSTSSSSARTRGGCRPARRSGSSCSSPRPSWSRCRPSRCTAGCPTGTRRCRCRCWRSSRGSSRRSRPTGSCASCCRCTPTPARTSRSSCC